MIICCILSFIIIFSLFFEIHYRESFDSNDYFIICSKYNKSTDFLDEIPIKSVVLQKNVDVPNIANEATTYLYYIIHNYDNLPNNMIFIHDENESWHHEGKITEKIYEWIEEYEENGKTYYEVNNRPQIVKNFVNKTHEKFWNDIFQPYFGDYDKCKKVDGKCCAQFIVSKQNVRKNPKELYERYYNWLITNTSGEGNGDENDPYSGHETGRYAEYTWNTLFTQ